MNLVRRTRKNDSIFIIKLLSFIIIVTVASHILIGCSSTKSVRFKEFYSQVIGFSDNDELLKPVPEDTILMMNQEDYQQFKDTYFTPREIPIDTPDKEKAVLYIQIPSSNSTVAEYYIKSINVKNKTLTINMKKSGDVKVDPVSGFNGTFKWVIFLEVDKANLKDHMKIVIKKS